MKKKLLLLATLCMLVAFFAFPALSFAACPCDAIPTPTVPVALPETLTDNLGGTVTSTIGQLSQFLGIILSSLNIILTNGLLN